MTASLFLPEPGPVPAARPQFTRIERVLDYIHTHLDEPLSLEQLAEQSCWSRWQLQRVFQHETGLTVAHYVRELKLSQAAEALLSGRERVLDLALCYGFGSEVSFSRAFKQHFGCSPLAYRKRGQRLGLAMPLVRAQTPQACASKWVQLRVESRPGFVLHGVRGEIRGLFAEEPDFHQTVPAIWRAAQAAGLPVTSELLGVVEVSAAGEALPYWAGVAATEGAILPAGLARLAVPPQEYAVLTHVGPIHQLAETLNWFILHWLPGSHYRGLDGFELERYGPHFNGAQADARMEYWLPVAPCEG
ncbi:helix-turn-helix domain-containing protein [Aeromonas lusitana]|uniref:AraC family transcriptional regulator n=1 Tax=Aeromonas lusitana TaxID=931529 RepID=A0A2M8HBW9_9GAMM|nr:helix-turn-helix domain-containing protein [Aeromonas lusitana]PJC94063.1 AraC family transcriptional regulator [Aeromonas lusitana]